MFTPQLLASAVRGSVTESVHCGHIAIADSRGKLLYYAGDPTAVTFARSCAKPLQAIPVIASGAADRFNLDEQELALLCASHSGEPLHTKTALRILRKIGADFAQLQCAPHEPYAPSAAEQLRAEGKKPSSLHNNCSGKHAGMLALARHWNERSDAYLLPEHPVQQAMLRAVAAMSDMPEQQIGRGTDGCGAPVFAMPLQSLAAAYARFGNPDGASIDGETASACRRLVAAIRRHPEYIAGTDRFDTALLQAGNGAIIGKMGAEGMFAAAVPRQGIGIAVKIADGAMRAVYPVFVELLRQLQLLPVEALLRLEPFRQPPLTNWGGDVVGFIRPEVRLRIP